MYKTRVIKATLEIIKENKLEKASIGEIMKKMKSIPGNLYYYFKNKNEIYKEVLHYSSNEITKSLSGVKKSDDIQDYLFELTENLVRFLESREEILNFLISIKGSCYMKEDIVIEKLLSKFKNALIKKESDEKILLKLCMFLGAINEVLYVNKLKKGRILKKDEIAEISYFFWGKSKHQNRELDRLY